MNRDEMTGALFEHVADFPGVRRKLNAILAPDSPLVWHTVTDTGDVIDVRAALVALGKMAEILGADPNDWLRDHGITGPLADLCIRLAEEAS